MKNRRASKEDQLKQKIKTSNIVKSLSLLEKYTIGSKPYNDDSKSPPKKAPASSVTSPANANYRSQGREFQKVTLVRNSAKQGDESNSAMDCESRQESQIENIMNKSMKNQYVTMMPE